MTWMKWTILVFGLNNKMHIGNSVLITIHAPNLTSLWLCHLSFRQNILLQYLHKGLIHMNKTEKENEISTNENASSISLSSCLSASLSLLMLQQVTCSPPSPGNIHSSRKASGSALCHFTKDCHKLQLLF